MNDTFYDVDYDQVQENEDDFVSACIGSEEDIINELCKELG
tara:strand:+ start:1494 stop:1616 length:123 start_codon:yes stop_codon:yes gene_type:complete